jgi:streptomycin 3"-adenylyltransferase
LRCKFPKNTPKSVRRVLREILSAVQSIIQDNLIGLYLHGSLAMDCYNPRSSDIDIIIVARERLLEEQRKGVIEYLKGVCSKGRRIELSIVCEDAIRNPRYPMIVDLHFEYWGDIFENERDKEILSNLYTTKERGFCVWGTPTSEVFSEIPARYHLRSVTEDIQHTRKHIHEKPERIGYDVTVYWILGSCRILAFIREEKVLSKLEGGHWGTANLPKKYRKLIGQALSSYQGMKKHGQNWKHEELEAFADYMTNTILKESKLKKR